MTVPVENTSVLTIERMSGNRLYEDLACEPQNRRMSDRLDYLSQGFFDIAAETDFVALDSLRKVVGVAGIQHSPDEERVIWLKFVSVDPAFRSLGVATRLADHVFEYAREGGLRIRASTYTDLGALHLKHILDRLAASHPDVGFKDAQDGSLFDLPERARGVRP